MRQATVADAHTIATHRCEMFLEMGRISEADYAPLHGATFEYLARAIPGGEYFGFLAELDGRVVAGGGVHMRKVMPRPGPNGETVPESAQALVVNVYCEPGYRRRGIAQSIMAAIETWARERGIPWIALHASDAGRPMYEKLGYKPTNEFGLYVVD